jgi:hypothetical protein
MAKTEECLRLASEPSTVAVTAALLRILAADYFQLARRASQRPQQDVHPGGRERKFNQ